MSSSCILYLLNQLTMHVLSIDPVTMREQSQLNWALLISPRWPIKVCNNLQKKLKIIIYVYSVYFYIHI